MQESIIIPVLCQFRWFKNTYVSNNLIASKAYFPTPFNIMWHAEATIYAKIFFDFVLKFLSEVGWITQGKWYSKINYVRESWMVWKMSLCKWHTFQMAPCLICYFIVLLFYIDRKWLHMRNLGTIFPLKCTLSWNFQRFNAIDTGSKYRKIVEFPKIPIKTKNWKKFTRPKQWAVLRILFNLPSNPPRIK